MAEAFAKEVLQYAWNFVCLMLSQLLEVSLRHKTLILFSLHNSTVDSLNTKCSSKGAAQSGEKEGTQNKTRGWQRNIWYKEIQIQTQNIFTFDTGKQEEKEGGWEIGSKIINWSVRTPLSSQRNWRKSESLSLLSSAGSVLSQDFWLHAVLNRSGPKVCRARFVGDLCSLEFPFWTISEPL